jgi:rubrerythrin
VKKPEKKATYEDIINIIIVVETNACKFYEDAAKKTKDKDAKKLFEALISMERAHVKQFKENCYEEKLFCSPGGFLPGGKRIACRRCQYRRDKR